MFPKSSHPEAGRISCIRWLGALALFFNAVFLMGAPVITLQTAVRHVLAPGSGTSLGVSATGSGELAYQWIKNGWPMSGATSNSLALANVAAADAGWYLCEVTDSTGTTRSKPVFVAVGSGLLWGPGDLESGVGYRTSLVAIAAEVVAVSAGFKHTLFLKGDGTLWAVGGNDYGQLGSNSPENPGVPKQVTSNVRSAVAAGNVSLFITNDDILWSMGDNSGGQLGMGQYILRDSNPTQVAGNVACVATSGNHTLFTKHDGTLWAMGLNSSGQLGDGTTGTRFSPVQIASGVATFSLGIDHTLFVKLDGTLWAMGANTYGQLGDGSTTSRLSPQQIATGVSKAVAGRYSTAFLKTDGTLWATGLNDVGQLGDGTNSNRVSPVQIASLVSDVVVGEAGSTTLFIKFDQSLWGNGLNDFGQLGDGSTTNRSTPVPIATEVVAAVTRSGSSLFIKSNGSLWGMGLNDFGQLGDGSLINRSSPIDMGVQAEAAVLGHGVTLVRDEAGRLLTTGHSDVGQLGTGAVVAERALFAHDVVVADIGHESVLYAKSDGSLWRLPGGQVVGVSEVVSVSVGEYDLYRTYVKSDGSLWRLMDDDSSVLLAEEVVSVGAGVNYVAYLKRDGTLWGKETHVWDDEYIRFGDGTGPVQVASNVTTLSAAAWHLLYVRGDQTLWGQGTPWDYWYPADVVWGAHAATPIQLDSGIVAAAAHHSHNIYTKNDGFVWSRGSGWRDSAGPAAVVVTGAPLAYASASRTFYLLPDGVLRSVNGVKRYLGVGETWAEGVVSVSCGTDADDFTFVQQSGVGDAPTIDLHPQPVSVTRGTPLILSVTASGGLRLDYQWFKDGVPIVGARDFRYQVTYAGQGDAGSYTVRVTNAAGTQLSNAAVVTTKAPPVVTWPQPDPIAYGTALSGTQLNAIANVAGSFEYVPSSGTILGLGVRTLATTFTPADTATYGSVTIQRSISVNQAGQTTVPSITSATSSTYGTPYAASATGAGFGYITWALGNGSTAAGAAINQNTGAITYTSAGTVVIKARFAGDYSHLPSDFSADFSVVINPAPASVTLGGSAAVYDGSPKSATATTNPTGLNVLFTYNGSATPPTMPGSYSVVATINNANYTGGAVGTLNITDNGPVVTGQSARRNVVEPGDDLTLSVTVAATGSPTYQWYHNGRMIAGAVGKSLLLSDATYNDNGAYWVTVANTAGQTRSAPFFLTVAPVESQIRAWGGGVWGQTTVPNTLADPVGVSSNGEHSVALRRDGTVVAWGNNTWQQSNVPDGLANVVSVAAGGHFSLALKADGTVVGWGESDHGQHHYYDNPTEIVAIAAGFRHSLLLKSDGTVQAYGQNTFGQCDVPANLAGVVAVAAGVRHSVALRSDGTVVIWGDQVDVPAEVTSVEAVVAQNYHTLALKADGTVVAWGAQFQYSVEVPQGLSGVEAIATGPYHLLAIKKDGSLVGWGANTQGEATAPADFSTDIFAASGGSGFTVALRDATDDVAPSITGQPSSQSMVAGQTGQLSVAAHGHPAPSYQWRKNSTPIPGATGAALTLCNLNYGTTDSYDVVVTNYLDSVVSEVAVVSVNSIYTTFALDATSFTYTGAPQGPVIVPIPSNATFSSGGTLSATNVGDYTATATANGQFTGNSNTLAWSIHKAASPVVLGNLSASYDGLPKSVAVTTSPAGLTVSITYDGSKSPPVAIGSYEVVATVTDNNYNGTVTGTLVIDKANQAAPTINSAGSFSLGSSYVATVASSGFGAVEWFLSSGSTTGASLNPVTGALTATGIGTVVFKARYAGDAYHHPSPYTADFAVVVISSIPAAQGGLRVSGDFDGDGHDDIFWSHTTTGERAMWLMDGTSVASGAVVGTVSLDWVISATGDFDGDGKSDLFWTNTSTGDRAAWLMNGSQVAGNAYLGQVPVEWRVSGAADFNGDGKDDILWSNHATGDRAIWLMNGSNVLGGGFLTTVDIAWQVSGTGDHNGDGKADVLWSNTTTGERAMWLMNGIAIADGAVIGTVPSAWQISGSGDYDGDGKADIFWTNTMTGDRSVWLMNGTQMANNAYLSQVPVQWAVSSSGDYNGDGKDDAFWTNTTTGDRAMWFMNGGTVLGGGYLTNVPLEWAAVP